MYIIKTIDRLKTVLKNQKMSYFFKEKFVHINGIKYPSIRTILSYLEKGVKTKYKGRDYELIKQTITPLKDDICFIHGDLVFSNVFSYRPVYINRLFYLGLNRFKCIDPRGSFGINKDFGDIAYDYSKIYQCVYGYYDFLIEGLFSLKMTRDNFMYRFTANNAIALCKSAFDSIFPKKYLDRIRIIESLQFLSMAPLHSDKTDHELVILAHGIVRFCGALRKI
ncbi:MAG: hypothetical protein MJ201_03480 [Mycoplasmoidaceae bacterium]|nr:hypothetical protein [Mycoplasmoidaceae bacterium]